MCYPIHLESRRLSVHSRFFFLCLFTSEYINSNLLLRQREKEKMQASIPTPSSGIFLLLLGCSYLAGSSVTSHPLCLSLTGQWKHPRIETYLHLFQTQLNINGHNKPILATWKFFRIAMGFPNMNTEPRAVSDTSCSFSFFRDTSQNTLYRSFSIQHIQCTGVAKWNTFAITMGR